MKPLVPELDKVVVSLALGAKLLPLFRVKVAKMSYRSLLAGELRVSNQLTCSVPLASTAAAGMKCCPIALPLIATGAVKVKLPGVTDRTTSTKVLPAGWSAYTS